MRGGVIHIKVKEQLCTPDIELLAVGMHPYYLQMEFISTIVIAVYIPLSADAVVACDVISSAAAKLQTEHPDAFMVTTGDFNHTLLDTTSTNMLTAPQETIKRWISCMLMPWMHMTPQPFPPLRPQLGHDDSDICPSSEKAVCAHQDGEDVDTGGC